MSEVRDPLRYLKPRPLRPGQSCPSLGCPGPLTPSSDGLGCVDCSEVFSAP